MVKRRLVYLFAAVILSIAFFTAVRPIYLSAKEAGYHTHCLQEMKTASKVIEEFAANHGDRFPTAAELEEITAKSSEPIRSTKWGVGFNSKYMGRKLEDVSSDVPILFSVERKSDRLIVGATLADARPAWGASYPTFSFQGGILVTSLADRKALDSAGASESKTR